MNHIQVMFMKYLSTPFMCEYSALATSYHGQMRVKVTTHEVVGKQRTVTSTFSRTGFRSTPEAVRSTPYTVQTLPFSHP